MRNNSDKAWENKKELPKQLKLARTTKQVKGNVFFSAKSLMNNNPDVVEYIKRKYYKTKALPPTSPLAPSFDKNYIELDSIKEDKGFMYLKFNNIKKYRYALIYTSSKKEKTDYPIKKLLKKVAVTDNQINLQTSLIGNKKHIALSFINKFGQESDPLLIQLNQKNGTKK